MKIEKEAGFTLVELLTVVAIIGIMSGVIAMNMMAEVKKSVVKEATTRLYSDLKKCRVDAMTNGGNAATRGFGLSFNNATSYTLFRFDDANNNYTLDSEESINPKDVDAPYDDAPEIVAVPNDVQVSINSGTLTAPLLFDRRGWLRDGSWSPVSGGTFILQREGTKPRCIVLSTSQIRQGVWDNAKADPNKCSESN